MFLALVAAIGFAATATAGGGEPQNPVSQTPTAELPKEKQTIAGLYVTAKEACEKWKAELSPDVRCTLV